MASLVANQLITLNNEPRRLQEHDPLGEDIRFASVLYLLGHGWPLDLLLVVEVYHSIVV